MIKTTVRDLIQGKVDHIGMRGIYTVRDNEYILYIGRSVDITRRLHDHIEHYSAIGTLIRANTPQSYNWQIEMREPEECREIAASFYPKYKKDPTILLSIEIAELAMIRYHRPCWNTSNNPNPNALPNHIKQYACEIEPGVTDNLF